MPLKAIPAVSIIIPIYNAEKYIGECLDSILAQTFTDYEVIVVDDCSTDKSMEVVESYLPKFNKWVETLKIIKLSKNNGAPGIPSNKGFSVSSGEYIFFIDADDLITKTALEELYNIAKKFDADVVQCKGYFMFADNTEKASLKSLSDIKAPVFLTDNLNERIRGLFKGKFMLNLWTKLIRRDFISQNKLEMINGIAQDSLYSCALICTAKKYVFAPNVVNYYREIKDSLSHKKDNVPATLHKWLQSMTKGFNWLDKFLSEREFFQKHPDIKYMALEFWINDCCNNLKKIFSQVRPYQIDAVIRHEFGTFEEKTALMSFLFSQFNVLRFKSLAIKNSK